MKAFLAALFAALWLLDTAATVSFVNDFGIAAEANPLMRAVFEWIGPAGFALSKAAVLTLWLTIHHRAHVAVHWGLLLIMAPVASMGVAMAWGAQ